MSALTHVRGLVRAVLAAAALVWLAGCGDDGGARTAAAPGTPKHPLSAQESSPESRASESTGKVTEGGFQRLLAQQRKAPARKDRSNPCALVTKAQAQAILGGRLLDPVLAKQGPTCIYRDRSGARFLTVAFQAADTAQLRGRARRVEPVSVGDRKAYCGVLGAPVLYVPVASGRVLSITAPCGIATRFARRALPRLHR